jgi:hypothetical protein
VTAVGRIVTLLTDYGTRDAYVAEVRAVLLAAAPEATLVDVTHEVPPGDIRAAQYLLARAWPRFPAGSVHLVVVDPGVGTARRSLAGELGGHRFVGPDNGVFSCVPDEARWVALTAPAGAAPTFHGRDVFAPAAARLARGSSLADLGEAVPDVIRAPLPAPRWDGAAWVGEVIYVDRFGTLVSNLPAAAVEPGARLTVDDRDVGPLRRTFGDVDRGALVAFVGSGGTIEVAVRNGSAARLLGAGVGAVVRA